MSAVLATGLLATVAPILVPTQASSADGIFDYPGAKQGAYLSMDAHNGTEELKAYRDFEGRWGRRSDMVRVFNTWSQPALFTPAQRTMAAEGRTLVVSWNSWDRGTGIRWSEVASGAYDADIDARAQEVKELGHPVLFTFQHEPENWTDSSTRLRAGTPADFCNAYRRVVDRFRAAEVTNASYGLIMMAWSSKTGTAESFYCGDAHVEWLAADGYNWYGCNSPTGPWRMPQTVFGDWYAWATGHGKPLLIAEWGTGEDPAMPGRKGQWIDALDAMVKRSPAIKGVIIFNTGKNPSCPRYSDTSPSSQAAFVAMGADAYYVASPLVAPSQPTVPLDVAVTQVGEGAAVVSWSPPDYDGGSATTGFELAWGPADPTDPASLTTTLSATARSHTLTDLRPGTSYTVSVRASNVVGVGPAASGTVTLGPVSTPGAPSVASVLRGAGQATVSWMPPERTGGSAISGYLVRRYDGTGGTVGVETLVGAGDRSYTATGLTNGSPYTFDVAALNDSGAGPASARSEVVVPATTPGAPRIGVATSGVSGGAITATATWTPPASTGGAPLTAYEVRALRMSDTGSVLGWTIVRQPATARSLELTLPRVASYRFVVLAVNDVGIGARSSRSNLVVGQ